MPLYEFKCRHCGMTFDVTLKVSRRNSAHPRCPTCGSQGAERMLPSGVRIVMKSEHYGRKRVGLSDKRLD